MSSHSPMSYNVRLELSPISLDHPTTDALEFSLKGDGKEWLWCVDPIDGTTNFASGLPVSSKLFYRVRNKYFRSINLCSPFYKLCVVSIGVAYKEQVVVGLVYNPVLEDMYTTIRGQGALCNGKPIKVAEGEISEAVVNCGCTCTLSLSI